MDSTMSAEVKKRERMMAARMLLTGMAERTSMHGMPNIHRSKHFSRKLFWSVVFFGALGLLLYMISEAIIKYYSYPVETIVTAQTNYFSLFPAVTICNMNAMRYSVISSAGSEFQALFQSPSPTTATSTNSSGPSYFDWDDQDLTQQNTEIQQQQAFSNLFTQLTLEKRKEYGHNLSTLLMSCTWNTYPCSPQNFTTFSNSLYGNCFTFNGGGINSTVQSINKIGPLYGLELEFYIEQGEYIHQLSEAAGIRMVIHNQSAMPFPEDEGISLRPATKTFIGLTRIEETRASHPYGSCQNFTAEEGDMRNMFTSIYPHITYTGKACKKTCYQQHVIMTCSCGDPSYPLQDSALTSYYPSAATIHPCINDTNGEVDCMNTVSTAFETNRLNCTAMCPHACFDVYHKKILSFADWPAKEKMASVASDLEVKSQYVYNIFENKTTAEKSEYIRENLLKVVIYFKDFDYSQIITQSSYSRSSLLSTLGGHVGLWLGLSVVTLFEFLELIWDVCKLFLVRFGQRHNKTESVKYPENTHTETQIQHTEWKVNENK